MSKGLAPKRFCNVWLTVDELGGHGSEHALLSLRASTRDDGCEQLIERFRRSGRVGCSGRVLSSDPLARSSMHGPSPSRSCTAGDHVTARRVTMFRQPMNWAEQLFLKRQIAAAEAGRVPLFLSPIEDDPEKIAVVMVQWKRCRRWDSCHRGLASTVEDAVWRLENKVLRALSAVLRALGSCQQ